MPVQFELPVYFTVGIVVLTIAGKVGDAFAPSLLLDSPSWLLALNSNDLHLALTANTVPRARWMALGMLRRLAEDPIFFLIGKGARWQYTCA